MQRRAWVIESARATAFTHERAPFDWSKVVGGEPIEAIRRPSEGLDRQVGNLGQARLVASVQPSRADLFVRASLEAERTPTATPSAIGEFPRALEEWKSVVTRWLASGMATHRLAIGIALMETVGSFEEARVRLQEMLPDVRVPQESPGDFLFQVNRPRLRELDKTRLLINRLSKWQIIETLLVVMVPQAIGAHPQANAKTQSVRLELDISTAADRVTHLPGGLLVPVFNELVKYGEEIAEQGDIK